jgi:hypothetical protein
MVARIPLAAGLATSPLAAFAEGGVRAGKTWGESYATYYLQRRLGFREARVHQPGGGLRHRAGRLGARRLPHRRGGDSESAS